MKLCILENDALAPEIQPHFGGYGAMFVRLFQNADASHWQFDVFHTPKGVYPASFDGYDAVLLTGSQADSFSDEPWVRELRKRVSELLAQRKKLIGICFGHQLIAYCLGAKVARAPQGWGVGCTQYEWHSKALPLPPAQNMLSLLASHQDQVLELPSGAQLLASNRHCPVAAYRIGNEVFCVQAHPEFVPEYSAFLLGKRRQTLEEDRYIRAIQSLTQAHDGPYIARCLIKFVEGD